MKHHKITIRVRYGETDNMGVVYHGNYFQYFEIGRMELLRTTGLAYSDLEKNGLFLVVVEASCKYKSSIGYDDEITITTKVSSISKARIQFDYVISKNSEIVAEGFTILASVDNNKKPIRLSDDIISRLSWNR